MRSELVYTAPHRQNRQGSGLGSIVVARLIDQIAEVIGRVLPAGVPRESEGQLRASLQSVFDRLDLVTREELEVQEAVLARTRARVEELEKKIAELEVKLLKK